MSAPLGKLTALCSRRSSVVLSCFCRAKVNEIVQKRHFNSRELKKFYKSATLSQYDGWFEINLDQRKLRTPGGNLFKVPHEALAMAVATEWNAQEKIIKRHNMHLQFTDCAVEKLVVVETPMEKQANGSFETMTSLCNTAIDNPMRKSRQDLIRAIIHYLETDTVSYRLDEPEDLLKLQEAEWGPVVRWAENRYKIKVPITTGIANSPDLPTDTKEKLERHLQHHSDWALFGYTFAVEALKSLVLTLAVMDKLITVERAVQLSRLEQDFQTQRWGNVEWYHDINLYEVRCRLAAAALFVQWTSETLIIKQKASLATPV